MTETKQIVIPGDEIERTNEKVRNGAYKCGQDKYCSEYFGIVQRNDQFIDIVPFTGPYFPRKDDKIIGKILEIGPSMWTVDINSPYHSLLHMNDTPWRTSAGDIKRYLAIGDYIYGKIMSINELRESWVTLKDAGLRKLEGGHIISIPAPKVPRIIGKGGSMVNMIKDATGTRIVVGQNGLIWLDGIPKNIMIAIDAIKMVENEAHTVGLTDRMEAYLESKKGEIDGNSK
ncbi:MAG: exosome complex RNA-binding protein Rrp4 [Candidatus Thermoplasmatota archaeon]|nr:exosome complex RNA-binding protein Rrp4 [Candidatus Thermoplasmatota archaeon]MCL5678936.1 exosome complex RNA-binding protein Rrp4 [Candidatus Thermoplasmatota archaeon]